MDTTDFIWMDGEFVKWADAKVHVLSHTLHYGSGAFEGIRLYKTGIGPAIFRLQEHTKRLFYSMQSQKLSIPYTEQAISDAIVETVRINKLEQGYIRPLAFLGYERMGLKTTGLPVSVSISCWPWGAYLPEMVDVKITKIIRVHPGSTVPDAKIIGNYANSSMACQEIHGTKYHEALLLDYKGSIAEGPGENFFIVKGGKILTPKLGTILAGITRATVIELAGHLGIPVEETEIKPEQAFAADESFFTGTAAEVTPIRSINDNTIGNGEIGPITGKLKTLYLDTVYGRNKEFGRYLTYVN